MTKTQSLRMPPATRLLLALLCAGLSAPPPAEAQQAVRFTDTIAPLGGKNLVPNGSFEEGAAGWSSLGERGAGYENAWAPVTGNWGNLATLHGEVERRGATDGRTFLRIRVGGADTPVLNFDYFYPVNRREIRPLAASLGWIEVTPGQPYTISVSMRASRDGVAAAFGVHNEDAGRTGADAQEDILQLVSLTGRWTRFSRTFTPRLPFVFVLAGPDLEREEDVAVDVDSIQLEKGPEATEFAPRGSLEIGIAPTAPAGVFTVGEPAALSITAFNSAATPVRAQVRFRVTDFADHPVEFPDVAFDVPADTAVERQVPLPDGWRGFYRVRAEYGVGRAQESRLLRLAFVPPRTTADTVIGVNHAYPTGFLLNLAKKAGVSWCRDWSLKWQHIEPAKDRFRWDVSDPQINRVVAEGMNPVAMFPFPSAEWNSTAPSMEALMAASGLYRGGGKGDDAELSLRARWAWLPRDVDELISFIMTGVSRYEGKVQVWEFLNEPLFTDYALPDSSHLDHPPGASGTQATAPIRTYTPRDYLDLVRVVAPAIRSANPNARIVGGPGMQPAADYTLQMVQGGLTDYVDILGIHDYPERRKPETLLPSMDTLQAVMRAHGNAKPIWVTEFSYFGTDDLPRKPFVPIPGLWSEPQLLSEKQVADYTVRFCTIFLGRGGEKIFLHSGCTGSVNHPSTESCMFADGAVRKIFPAMAVFTEKMGPAPQLVGDRTGERGYIFAFETGQHSTLVLWDPEEGASVPVPAGATCEDIMGRGVPGASVHLTGSPIYLTGDPGYAKQFLAACTAPSRTAP
jgi:hypothetical protein